jgi:hypothetical protein
MRGHAVEREQAEAASATAPAPEHAEDTQATRYTSHGPIPPVAPASEAQHQPSASERAHGVGYGPYPAGGTTERYNASLWALDKDGKPLPPTPADVAQAALNDCYLMAALAAIANTHPERIMKMISDHGGGVYTVHFRQMGWSYVAPSVTATFEKHQHATLGERQALWPLIIEKAFAQTKGGLDKFQTGNPATVLADMFGMETSSFVPSLKEPAAILGTLSKAKADNKAITASSAADLEDAKERKQRARDVRVHFNHVYTVLDVNPARGEVKLFNPWGRDHPNGEGWLKIEDFKELFIGVNVSN